MTDSSQLRAQHSTLAARLWNYTPARRVGVAALHGLVWIGAFALALWIRFDGAVPKFEIQTAQQAVITLLVLRSIAFLAVGLFHGIWRYAGFPELEKIVLATTAASAVAIATDLLLFPTHSPRSVYLGEWLASIVLAGGMRLLLRSMMERRNGRGSGVRTVIIGAGDAGESLVRNVQRMMDGLQWSIAGFLDDDPAKRGARIRGVPVLGRPDEPTLARLVRSAGIQLAVLAMPTAPGPRIRQLVQLCRALGVDVKTVPALADLIVSPESIKALRPVNIDDLLRREPVQLDLAQIHELVQDRVVLVTGAGGSIGSELCRQLLRFRPRALLLADHDENALFHVDRELREKFPSAQIEPLMADITDAARVGRVFAQHRPSLVLHAAAHKHVSMMEANPCEAAKNNVFGTEVLAEAAQRHGVDTFVLVSTDKAVRPTSVMGCTKRVTEMLTQTLVEASETRFVTVRFGNVLGSAGSVVPIFQEQIARGGPVTVRHPEVARYFMTIGEAAQLVLQAAALGNSGDILMLDMGEHVKIVDLARDLIALSGLRPGVDVEIVFSELEPGEKLVEELLEAGSYDRTQHPKIMVGRTRPVSAAEFELGMYRLRAAAFVGDAVATRAALSWLVPESNLDGGTEPPSVLRLPPRSSIFPRETPPPGRALRPVRNKPGG